MTRLLDLKTVMDRLSIKKTKLYEELARNKLGREAELERYISNLPNRRPPTGGRSIKRKDSSAPHSAKESSSSETKGLPPPQQNSSSAIEPDGDHVERLGRKAA